MKKYLLILLASSLLGSTYSQTTVTFNYTGAVQTWTVPACVTSISVDVRGADGGGANGGNGARVTHPNIAVTPGQVLQIRVGGSGGIPTAGWNGGGAGANAGGSCGVVPSCGGGGASDIRVAPYAMGNRIIVAGGGGGRNGGSTNVAGGGGGCNNGLMGTSSYGVGGAGGTQVTGGNGGGPWGGGAAGQAGSLGQGGNGAADPCYNYGPGGGGGGGYYGGGGGGSDCFPGCPLGGGGGGGGSSFTPAGGACTQSFNNGAGIVSITYTGGSPPLVVSNTGPYCELATVQLNSTAGGLTYTWTGPNGFTSTLQNPTLPLADTLMSGMYILTMTMAGGCSSTDTTVVFVNPNPNAVATNTGPYCVGDVVQLTSVAGLPTDDWTGPGGYSVIDVQNPTLTPAAVAMSGSYTVTIANGFGCSNTASTTVVVNPLPAAVAGNTGPYCEGDVVDVTSNGGVDYDWTGPGGFVLNNTQNTTIPGAAMGMNGTYTVTVTDANNCVSTATTTMVVNLLPIPTANNTGPYCAGETISLTSSGGTGYAWTGPAVFMSATQNPNIAASMPTQSGTYDVLVTSAFGCTATASTVVLVTALPIPTASNTGDYCEGERVDLSSTGGLTYAWVGPLLFNSSNPNPSINGSVPDNSGTYTVTVTDVAGCTSSTTTIVVVHPTPTAVPLYGPDKPSTLNPEVTFMDGSYANIVDWLWEFDNTSYNTANFTHTFLTSGTYNGVLTVTNTWGCVDTSVFQVIVIPEIAIYIPNSFTPNDDGLNEIFYIYGTNWSRMETVIFDRWGMQVFSSTDPEKGWNGRMNNNGELLQEGTYAYKVYIIDNYGKEHDIMGHINLLR